MKECAWYTRWRSHCNRSAARIGARHAKLGWLLSLVCVFGCSTGDDNPRVESVLARDRAAAHFNANIPEYQAARDALKPVLDRKDPALEDLLRIINIELADAEGDQEAALAWIERATALDPDHATLHWARYRIARVQGQAEEALQHVERVFEAHPDDFITRLAYANALADVNRAGEAEPHYQALVARGTELGPNWQFSVLYRYMHLLYRWEERDEEADQLRARVEELQLAGIQGVKEKDMDRGSFGDVLPATPGEVLSGREWELWMKSQDVEGRIEALAALERPGIEGLLPIETNDAWQARLVWTAEGWLSPEEAERKEFESLVHRTEAPRSRLLVYGAQGVDLVELDPAGTWRTQTVHVAPTTAVARFEIDYEDPKKPEERKRDSQLDLLIGGPDGVVVLLQSPGKDGAVGFTPVGEPLLRGFAVKGLTSVDFDHDGDLDFVAVGSGGTRLLRNDGIGRPGGKATEVTEEAGLPREAAFAWCLTEDFDLDQDVDLLLGGAGRVFLADNVRNGRFEDRTESLPGGLEQDDPPLATDADSDGWPDLVAADAKGLVRHGARELRRWQGPEAWAGDFHPRRTLACDPFSDGHRSLLCASAEGIHRVRRGAETTLLFETPRPVRGLWTADLNGDRSRDLVTVDERGLRVYQLVSNGHFLDLALRGVKDNRFGIGAWVEVRSGPFYRRLYWRGEPMRIGIAGRRVVDVCRITWPNGIVQDLLDLPIEDFVRVLQKEGLPGSCPFLYAWNGATYEFISDVLGITPLGLPMNHELLVPPDHDEYVLVRGDQLVPRDGFYDLQFTEELREVTYLDRIRLDVVDHPLGTEIYPNERFTFPPFPEPHTHTVRAPLAPTRATGTDGHDWTAQVAAIDGDYERNCQPLRGQFLGLAQPHYLELEWDPDAVAGATKLRLLLTGWFYWSDASVNVSAATDPQVEFVPPVLQVPDGQGGWRTVDPPLGFPAGKVKTMVCDVTELFPREEARIRIASTLELYWDAVRLAIDADDAELVVTSLEPASAELWERGFSEPLPVLFEGMDWFEWDKVATTPRWNQHPGFYTRYGETRPLLEAVDDRFVILGAGDALRVRFDASQAPPLRPGYVRDFLVFLDGWAKDRDPNTKQALGVKPYPFHGMSSYPYGPDEAFPDSEEHRAWEREYNTRPAKRWIEPLRPRGPRFESPTASR